MMDKTLSANRGRNRLAVIAALLTLAAVEAASAHHAQPEYNHREKNSITGTVTEFRLTNPHSWIEIAVDLPDGGIERWSFEGESVVRLRRVGWVSDLLKPGDMVVVAYSPRRDGRPGGVLRGVTAPDGEFYPASREDTNLRFGAARP